MSFRNFSCVSLALVTLNCYYNTNETACPCVTTVTQVLYYNINAIEKGSQSYIIIITEQDIVMSAIDVIMASMPIDIKF